MKILLHKSSLARIEQRLAASGLPLEIYVLDEDGTVRHRGEPVARDALKPEVIWLSLDAFEGRQMRVLFDAALNEPSVKWVHTFSAGLDWPLFRQIFDRGVRMSNSNAQAIAIAEYVLTQVLAEWHPVAAYRAAQRDRQWQRIRHRELWQSRWLIVGYGHIGREIARRAKAFGATVTGIRRNPAADEFADAMAVLDELPQHLPAADFVVLACGLNEATRDLAGPAFFGAMKRGSFLVNIGRGGLVDEAALLKALDADAPALAILDVFRQEPLPRDSPFWDHPKVRLTGHTSAASRGTMLRGDQLFLDNLGRFARGERLLNEVGERSF
ncbi:MAG TPA: D-2-hydroxyacid dehydrogenase [Candidatus Sulfotelmatobacter sp.]|nr:D-2-hydroxyacid dehydrogenase [Candidatus Sulfotelmatobacter sp.]